MRRIVEAIQVDALPPASFRLEPGTDPGIWTLSGIAAIVDLSGKREDHPYRAALENRCEAYDQSRCWNLKGLSVGQWTLSDDAPTVSGLAGLSSTSERQAETPPSRSPDNDVRVAQDSRYQSPDPSKVFEEIRLARRVRDAGRSETKPLPVLPEVPLPPAPEPAQDAGRLAGAIASESAQTTQATQTVQSTTELSTVAVAGEPQEPLAEADQNGLARPPAETQPYTAARDGGSDLTDSAEPPTPEQLALAIRSYRNAQGGAASDVPSFGKADWMPQARGVQWAGPSSSSLPKPVALAANTQVAGLQSAVTDAQDFEGVGPLLRKAEDGDARAQFELAEKYRLGDSVEQNYAKAVTLYRRAAEQGDASALYRLGTMSGTGEGLKKDLARAVELYRNAAGQGHPGAQYALAQSYDKGLGISEDTTIAIEWYRMAAEQGNASAQLALGNHYRIGKGIARDLSRSIAWYRRAAKQGNSWAQFELGNSYRYGKGVKRDVALALGWLQLSADAGNSAAQFALASMHAKGEAIDQDRMPIEALLALDAEPKTRVSLPQETEMEGRKSVEVSTATDVAEDRADSEETEAKLPAEQFARTLPFSAPSEATSQSEAPKTATAFAAFEKAEEVSSDPVRASLEPKQAILTSGDAVVARGGSAVSGLTSSMADSRTSGAVSDADAGSKQEATFEAEAETERALAPDSPQAGLQAHATSASDLPPLDDSLELLAGAADEVADPIPHLLDLARQQLADLALTTPRGASAYDTYQEILAINPDHPEALDGIRQIGIRYVGLAERAWERGALRQAETYVKKALKLAPDHPRVLAMETEWAAVKRESQEVSSPVPLLENTKMLSPVAMSPPQEEQPQEEEIPDAKSLTLAAVTSAPIPPLFTSTQQSEVSEEPAPLEDPAEEVLMHGLLYAQAGLEAQQEGDLKAAIKFYLLAIEAGDLSDKSLAFIYNNVGASYRSMGSYDLAIESYDAAIRLRPEYATAFFNRGIAYDQQGLDGQAIDDFDTAIRLRPDLLGAYHRRGLAYMKAGRYDLAVADFSEAIRLDPHLDTAYFNRAQAYQLKGDRERAVQDIEKSYSMNPGNLDYQGKMKEFGLL